MQASRARGVRPVRAGGKARAYLVNGALDVWPCFGVLDHLQAAGLLRVGIE